MVSVACPLDSSPLSVLSDRPLRADPRHSRPSVSRVDPSGQSVGVDEWLKLDVNLTLEPLPLVRAARVSPRLFG